MFLNKSKLYIYIVPQGEQNTEHLLIYTIQDLFQVCLRDKIRQKYAEVSYKVLNIQPFS